jgi:signal transduction histidine kinase
MGEEVRVALDRCERLLEGLLMLARSEAAAGREEPVNLAALAGDCVTDLHARANELELTIRTDLQPAWTQGEEALLERMIANLVENAIRYNERGGFVEVQTRADGRHVQVSVANSGAVITGEDARRLTEPFARLSRAEGGFGLGLSIVASVVAAHHGNLVIEPRQDGGLSVTIEFPASQPRPAAVRASKESPALTRN